MALLHHAELHPSKLELIAGWAPSQPWFSEGSGPGWASIASYRFDDPLGEVGIETLLVAAGSGPILQVPLTYRNAPLPGAGAWLVGTMQHSVLGKRWTYDALGDPAYLAALATAALAGGHQADQYYEVDGRREPREPTAVVAGSGQDCAAVVSAQQVGAVTTSYASGVTVAETAGILLAVVRDLGDPAGDAQGRDPRQAFGEPAGEGTTSAELTGTWAGHPAMTLAAVRTRSATHAANG